MSSKFISSLSQSANQINGYGLSKFLLLPMRGILRICFYSVANLYPVLYAYLK